MKTIDGILFTKNSPCLFMQLPGYVVWMDTNQIYMGINEQHSHALGFKKPEHAIGKTTFEVPCPLSEMADIFKNQEAEIINSGITKKYFGILRYEHGYQTLITVKKPLVDTEGNIVGIFIHGYEIGQCRFIQSAYKFIIESWQYRAKKNNTAQLGYEIVESNFNLNLLTMREEEILFFCIRGAATKVIAKTLDISTKTVEHHLENIKNKLNCKTKAELICKALETGLADRIPFSLLNKSNNEF